MDGEKKTRPIALDIHAGACQHLPISPTQLRAHPGTLIPAAAVPSPFFALEHSYFGCRRDREFVRRERENAPAVSFANTTPTKKVPSRAKNNVYPLPPFILAF